MLVIGVTMLLSCSTLPFGVPSINLPKEINGWTKEGEVRTFNRKTLFDYIDGGAELYLAYRFRKVYASRYRRADESDIIVDVYDMTTPRDAFGVFTAEREGPSIGIGQESEYDTGLLRFFKGQFFVSILTQEETEQSREAVFSLARAVADQIETAGSTPDLLSRLPPEGLIENSVRYFYDPTILDVHYYVADENVFLLDKKSDAVLARYAIQEGNPYLLLIRYTSNQKTSEAYESFVTAYMPDAKNGVVQTEDGLWTAVRQRDTLLAVVFEAPSAAMATALLEAVYSVSEGGE
jgi:hypothetical protein